MLDVQKADGVSHLSKHAHDLAAQVHRNHVAAHVVPNEAEDLGHASDTLGRAQVPALDGQAKVARIAVELHEALSRVGDQEKVGSVGHAGGQGGGARGGSGEMGRA